MSDLFGYTEARKFTTYNDPGHGWLKVTLADMREAGLSPADFTSYSYMDGEKYFLEEDCDAGKFLNAFEQKVGPFELIDKYVPGNSSIRRLHNLKGNPQ